MPDEGGIFHPDAAAEVEAGFEWYVARSDRVARQFLAELERGIAVVLESPAAWVHVVGPWRRYPLRRFPYSIIFRETQTGIEIVAIAHGKRRPGYWRHRVP
jgi:plasmid stabilization system protein ParE